MENNEYTQRKDIFKKIDSGQALRILQEGNKRFTENRAQTPDYSGDIRGQLAEKGQAPFACIFGCSDSRVPPEQIFDVGLGQLFVIRTAGNTADDIAIGSAEYAAEHLHVPLIVVLGHSGCGAVAAAVSGGQESPCIQAIVNEIKPALDIARRGEANEVTSRCEDENILHTAEKLKANPVLAELAAHGELRIMTAKYDLKTGAVRFNNL